MNQVVVDLSDSIVVYNPSIIVSCPNCLYDIVTNKSSGIFNASFSGPIILFSGTTSQITIDPQPFDSYMCPVCWGEGKLEATSYATINALVDFFPEELYAADAKYDPLPYGKDGKTYIIVKTSEKNYDILLNCLYISFNGIRYEKIKPPLYDGIGINALVICWFTQVATDARIS
jgi:hypothetical protein